MLVDSLTLLDGSVVHNATVESGTALPAAGSSTLGELFYLTSGTVGLYIYTGSAWTIIPLTQTSITKLSQLTNDVGFITSSSLPTKVSQLTNDTGFITSSALTTYAPLASPNLTGRTQSDAYSYTVSALGNVSGTKTMDLAAAGEFTMTITGATTFAFTNTLAASRSEVVYLRITNGGSATITWPASTKFAAATAPTLTASGTDLLGVKYDTTTSTYMVFVIGLAIA